MAERDEAVLADRDQGVLLLTFNRPERMNAWTADLEDAYFDHLEAAAADPEVRAIVVTGAGRGFCPGADMEELADIARRGGLDSRSRRPQTLPLGVPKPIIAAVNGACAGIGLAQALMCDIRLAAAGVKFTTAFARRGLVAEHGMSWILPRLLGPAVALDLLLSARVVQSEEAAELGLVNAVYPPDQLVPEALAYARDLAANCSPTSMAVIKAMVYRHLELPLASAMTEANRIMTQSLGWPDMTEGVASFVERRAPRFPPLSPPPPDPAGTRRPWSGQ